MSSEGKNSQKKLFKSLMTKEQKKNTGNGLDLSTSDSNNDKIVKSFLVRSKEELIQEKPNTPEIIRTELISEDVKPRFMAKELSVLETKINSDPRNFKLFELYINVCKQSPKAEEGERELYEFLHEHDVKMTPFPIVYKNLAELHSKEGGKYFDEKKKKLCKRKEQFYKWVPKCCKVLVYSDANYALFSKFSNDLLKPEKESEKLKAISKVNWKVLIQEKTNISTEFMIAVLLTYSRQPLVQNSPMEKHSAIVIGKMLDELSVRLNERDFVFTGSKVIKSDLLVQICELVICSKNKSTISKCLEILCLSSKQIEELKLKELKIQKESEYDEDKVYSRLLKVLEIHLNSFLVSGEIFNFYWKINDVSIIPTLQKYIRNDLRPKLMRQWSLLCIVAINHEDEDTKEFLKTIFLYKNQNENEKPEFDDEIIPYAGIGLYKITGKKIYAKLIGSFKKSEVPESIVWFLKAGRLDNLNDEYKRATKKTNCEVQ